MNLEYAIGDTLRDLRLERGLTLREVSTRSNVSLGYLSEVERGEKSASGSILEAICVGLDITMIDLVGEIYEYLKESNG